MDRVAFRAFHPKRSFPVKLYGPDSCPVLLHFSVGLGSFSRTQQIRHCICRWLIGTLLRFWWGDSDLTRRKRAERLLFRSLDGNYFFGLVRIFLMVNQCQHKTLRSRLASSSLILLHFPLFSWGSLTKLPIKIYIQYKSSHCASWLQQTSGKKRTPTSCTPVFHPHQ